MSAFPASQPTKGENMDKEIKAQWIAALRSGRYRQGYCFLKAEVDGISHFCCLGVLCELALEAGVVSSEMPDNAGIVNYAEGSYTLPAVVRHWSGIQSSVGSFRVNGRRGESLATLNDTNRLDFNSIAIVIENEL